MTVLGDILEETRLLAIVRGRDADASVATCRALAEEGVRALEVSLTTADALSVIERVASAVDDGVLVGAGTVLESAQVARVRDAGARFVVTPALAPSVDTAAAEGMPVLAGAMTPTEVLDAIRRGAELVKLFPASALGPDYVRAVLDPFPTARLVPVGGVGLAEARANLAAGAIAVGVGSPLSGDAPHGGDLTRLRIAAREFLAAVR